VQSAKISLKYILLLVLVFFCVVVIEEVTQDSSTFFTSLANTLFVTLIILVLYTIGVSLIVRKIPDEASRFTAIRIFMVILLGIGAFLALTAWINNPAEIVLTLGIIWGAIFIALRDLIQNVIGSLMLLVTGTYRIGDHVRVRGIYGLVMDIGILRTTLMVLDKDAGDRPVGEIVTVPNGILFREVVTNTSRQISVISDEIRITVPFNADLVQVRAIVNEVITRHTAGIETQAAEEIKSLRQRKFLAGFEIKPTIHLQLSDYGIVLVVTYITASAEQAAIKSAIIEDVSKRMQGICRSEK